jgi:hypothetical protein
MHARDPLYMSDLLDSSPRPVEHEPMDVEGNRWPRIVRGVLRLLG